MTNKPASSRRTSIDGKRNSSVIPGVLNHHIGASAGIAIIAGIPISRRERAMMKQDSMGPAGG